MRAANIEGWFCGIKSVKYTVVVTRKRIRFRPE